VWNSPKRFEDPFDQIVGEQQRVAARQDDIPHFCVFPEVSDGPIQLTFLEEARFPDQPFSRAEAAIDRTLIGDHEQHAIRVAVDEMRHRTHEVFFEGIVFRVEVGQFGHFRDDLFPDRIALGFDRAQDGRGDPHGIGSDDGFEFFGVEPESFSQIFRFHNAFRENLFPVFH
jgi:hypothetical protein